MKSKHNVFKYTTSPFGFPALMIFLLMKTIDPAMFAWSAWWCVMPIVPVLIVTLQKLGL